MRVQRAAIADEKLKIQVHRCEHRLEVITSIMYALSCFSCQQRLTVPLQCHVLHFHPAPLTALKHHNSRKRPVTASKPPLNPKHAHPSATSRFALSGSLILFMGLTMTLKQVNSLIYLGYKIMVQAGSSDLPHVSSWCSTTHRYKYS